MKKTIILISSVIAIIVLFFVLLLVISFNYSTIDEKILHKKINNNKEDIYTYIYNLDNDIKIIDEEIIHNIDFNTGTQKAFIVYAETKEGIKFKVTADFYVSKQKYSLISDFDHKKLNYMLLKNKDIEFINNNNIDIKDIDIYYYYKDEYVYINLNESIKKEEKQGEFIENNYTDILNEMNINRIKIEYKLNEEFAFLYDENVSLYKDKMFDFYRDLEKSFPNYEVDLVFDYYVYGEIEAENIKINGYEKEKELFLED